MQMRMKEDVCDKGNTVRIHKGKRELENEREQKHD